MELFRLPSARLMLAPGMGGQMLAVGDLQGLWRRSLIVWPNGARDRATSVHWLQGPTIYTDLRQPPHRPDFRGVTALDDLTRDQIGWLAGQEGFAGYLRFDGEYFEWQRTIDYQPKAVYSDSGRLWLELGMMVEQGRDIPYIEHWHRDEPADDAPCGACRLLDRDAGCAGFLVRVGSVFMYARDRMVRAPDGISLSECVERAATLQDARSLIDCEISVGHVGASGWTIERSSLPFREGQNLALSRTSPDTFANADLEPDGRPFVRHWSIVDTEGDIAISIAPVAVS